jgi:hypothetical protein
MKKLAFLTPSYGPDFAVFESLHKTVLRYTDIDVVHHVVVPSADMDLFRRLSSARLRIHNSTDVLGRSFVSVYGLAQVMRALRLSSFSKVQAINLRKPWVPLRGWIIQQIVKLAMAAEIESDVTLIVDSDVVIVQPIDISAFTRNGAVRLYKWANVVGPHMPQHVKWLAAARTLLDLPESTSESQPDYIAGFISWDPVIVRRMLNQISALSETDWRSRIAGELYFSECMLYGTYVEHFGSKRDRSFIEPDTLCKSYWSTQALTEADATKFAASVGKDCLAVQIQSTSHTTQDIRLAIARMVEDRLMQTN